MIEREREARVGWLVGVCCSFVPSLSRCLLHHRCSCVASRSLGLSLVNIFILEHLLFVLLCLRSGLSVKRWETILLIVMLESSSRLAPRRKAMLTANLATHRAWCSTNIEASCSYLMPSIVECKYSRKVMTRHSRSCPSSARKATDQSSSAGHGALRSITIMIASSSLIPAIFTFSHGH